MKMQCNFSRGAWLLLAMAVFDAQQSIGGVIGALYRPAKTVEIWHMPQCIFPINPRTGPNA